MALADAMRSRIDALGLTTLEIGHRGGPPRGTLREILHARRIPRRRTLIAIDRVLGWPPGLAKDILDGKCEPPDPDESIEKPVETRLGLIRSSLVHQRKEHVRLASMHSGFVDELTDLIDLIDQERSNGSGR